MSNCPICQGADFEALGHQKDPIQGNCRICGPFRITSSALEKIRRDNNFYLLSAFFRQQKQGLVPLVSDDNLEELLKTVAVKLPSATMESLLLLLAEETPVKGQYSNFDATYDYPLLAIRPEEVEFYMDALEEQKLIVKGPSTGKVTMQGWDRVSQLRRPGCDSIFVFVAMWFDKSMEDFYEKAIAPAISDAGYLPFRINLWDHVNKIDEEIISWMKKSKFMVADFTGQRRGVYFEAGFMVGLGKNVIWTCRKDQQEALHFDISHYNFILYETIDEFKNALYKRIVNIEGFAKSTGAAGRLKGVA